MGGLPSPKLEPKNSQMPRRVTGVKHPGGTDNKVQAGLSKWRGTPGPKGQPSDPGGWGPGGMCPGMLDRNQTIDQTAQGLQEQEKHGRF